MSTKHSTKITLFRHVLGVCTALVLAGGLPFAQAQQEPVENPAPAPPRRPNLHEVDPAEAQRSIESISAELAKLTRLIGELKKKIGDGASDSDREIASEIKQFEARVSELRMLAAKKELTEADQQGPSAGTLSPNQIDVGEIYVDATVEASVRVYCGATTTAGLAANVKPPQFVKVKNIALGSDSFGAGVVSYCDLSLSIVTIRSGELSGKLQVEIGDQKSEIPIRATVREPSPESTRVLVISSPFTAWSTSDAKDFDPWLSLVKAAKLNVDYWLAGEGRQSPLRDQDLSKFDVVLLQDSGLVFLQPSDVQNLKQFMSRGGRVVMVASHFMMGTVPKANDLMLPYGLQFVDSELHDWADLSGHDIEQDRLTSGVQRLAVHRPTPIVFSSLHNGENTERKILAHYPKLPSDSPKAFAAYAKAGDGELIVLGVPLWWKWIGRDNLSKADNNQLLQNVLTVPQADRKKNPPAKSSQ
jgi:hypothetical protein